MLSCQKCGADLLDPMACEQCGWVAPRVPALERTGRLCPADHAVLEPNGFCPKGKGFPLNMPCLFACPICRAMLDWSGGCESCHGSYTGERVSWTFPGDRYDCYDDKGQPIGDGRHWVRTDGPRKASTPTQNLEGLKAIQRVLAKSTLATKQPPVGR